MLHKLRNSDTACRAIVGNAGSLFGTTMITSVLGFVYWWLAARYLPPATVGMAATLVSTMQYLGMLGMLGLGTLLVRELARHTGQAEPLISTALLAACLAGGGLGLLFSLLAPRLSSGFSLLATSVVCALLFSLGCGLTAATLVLDQALIGLLRGGLQFWRNGAFAGLKLGALVAVCLWLRDGTGFAILATWVLGIVGSLLMLMGRASREPDRRRSCRPRWQLLRSWGLQASSHHLLNLCSQAPNVALLLIVAARLSAESAAYFYTAWMVVGFAFAVSVALTTALYAVGARDATAIAEKIRYTMLLAALIGLLANAAVLLFGQRVLGAFGGAYAAQAGQCLGLLMLGIFPRIIKDHFVTLGRIRGQIGSVTIVVMLGSGLEITLATLGADRGALAGLGRAWLAALVIEALVMLRPVWRAMFPGTVWGGGEQGVPVTGA